MEKEIYVMVWEDDIEGRVYFNYEEALESAKDGAKSYNCEVQIFKGILKAKVEPPSEPIVTEF